MYANSLKSFLIWNERATLRGKPIEAQVPVVCVYISLVMYGTDCRIIQNRRTT